MNNEQSENIIRTVTKRIKAWWAERTIDLHDLRTRWSESLTYFWYAFLAYLGHKPILHVQRTPYGATGEYTITLHGDGFWPSLAQLSDPERTNVNTVLGELNERSKAFKANAYYRLSAALLLELMFIGTVTSLEGDNRIYVALHDPEQFNLLIIALRDNYCAMRDFKYTNEVREFVFVFKIPTD